MAFTVKVEGLSVGAKIPRRYTCAGQDIPPRVQWTDEPTTTKSFAVIMDDPDAPLSHFLAAGNLKLRHIN